jgi:hypothetical protein
MDNNNQIQNKLKTINDPIIFYSLIGIIVFLIIMLILVLFNVNISSNIKVSSDSEVAKNVFIILFFTLIIVFICFMFLPNLKEIKELFAQINNVFYVILFTIFFILFYSLMPDNILNSYYYIINPVMLLLLCLFFYKATKTNYVENFNIGYERIKIITILFCLISILITFYNINPGDSSKKYFGYSFLFTILLAVFGFLYLIIVLTLSDKESNTKTNLLSNFSYFGTFGTLSFFIFLAIITIIISDKIKNNGFANKSQFPSVVILSLLISLLWSFLLSANLFNNDSKPIQKLELFKNSLLMLFGLIISGLFIFWISSNIESLSSKSSIVQFILNLLIIILVIGLIYKTIQVKIPVGNSRKNAFFSLLLNVLFYIPCLATGLFGWIGKTISNEYNGQKIGDLIMIVVLVILIVIYCSLPSLFKTLQGGQQLVDNPVYTDTQYNLGSYVDLNGGDNFDYQYAISCWIYIDSAPPNTNSSYNKYTSLLNFGNKPNILYNGIKNSLMITMQQKDLKNVTNNKLTDFDDDGNRIIYVNNHMLLQKWNNIIINYNGGTLDIFLNGELVKSSIEVVPYYTLDNLTIGENDGIKGGICNVVYFRNSLTSKHINFIYNTFKKKTPPTLSNSSKTILVKNNSSFNSG